jgi:addiction module HigA family antidote
LPATIWLSLIWLGICRSRRTVDTVNFAAEYDVDGGKHDGLAENVTFEVRTSLATRKKITRSFTHPGVLFARDVLPELRQRRTLGEIATLLGVSRQQLHRVLTGQSAITPDLAARLGKLCGNGADLWLCLQATYDALKTGPAPFGRGMRGHLRPADRRSTPLTEAFQASDRGSSSAGPIYRR